MQKSRAKSRWENSRTNSYHKTLCFVREQVSDRYSFEKIVNQWLFQIEWKPTHCHISNQSKDIPLPFFAVMKTDYALIYIICICTEWNWLHSKYSPYIDVYEPLDQRDQTFLTYFQKIFTLRHFSFLFFLIRADSNK